jgi:hypothetical protein
MKNIINHLNFIILITGSVLLTSCLELNDLNMYELSPALSAVTNSENILEELDASQALAGGGDGGAFDYGENNKDQIFSGVLRNNLLFCLMKKINNELYVYKGDACDDLKFTQVTNGEQTDIFEPGSFWNAFFTQFESDQNQTHILTNMKLLYYLFNNNKLEITASTPEIYELFKKGLLNFTIIELCTTDFDKAKMDLNYVIIEINGVLYQLHLNYQEIFQISFAIFDAINIDRLKPNNHTCFGSQN